MWQLLPGRYRFRICLAPLVIWMIVSALFSSPSPPKVDTFPLLAYIENDFQFHQ
jgi:hypothetical protein